MTEFYLFGNLTGREYSSTVEEFIVLNNIDGGKVIQAFLKEDLINELIISKVPVLIGSGIPLFGYLDKDLAFKHIKTDTCSNGLVRSYYKRK